MKRKGVLLLCFLCYAWWLPAQNGSALQQLLQTEGLKQAAVGISVKSVADGGKVVEYRPDMALTPASVMKLLPTWLALREKGENYQYQTPVYYSGALKDSVLEGNIVVVSQGDPTLDSKYFPKHAFVRALATAIEKKGIRRIRGKVIVENACKGCQVPGSWPWEDVSNYYAALYLPFNYRDNMFTLQFCSGEAGKPVKLVSVTPSLPGVEIRNEVTAATGKQDNAWIFGGPYSSVLCVRGTIPAHRPVFRVKGAMHDPAAVFVAELERALLERHIRIDRGEIAGEKRQELIKINSPVLREIVFHTNKSSVNLFAEALGTLVPGEDWAVTVEEKLRRNGINASGMILKDICGLSPLNAVPAQVFTDLLVHIGRQKQAAWINSLPEAGVDGGLLGYCHASPELKNRLRAKTGSMSGVRCLSGFITRKNGEQLAFTILVNHYTCTTAELQKAVEQFLSTLL